jgi:putative chitinase
MKKFQINTKSRITNFLSQVLHESGSFQFFTELASGKAYEGRKDLGNTQPGDGVRYKGRGAIQITGRNNYSRISKALGYDFVSDPKKLAELPWAMLSAGWFWRFGSARGDLNKLADKEDFEKITRGINGGTNGIADRRKKLNVAKSVYKPVKPGDNNSLLA